MWLSRHTSKANAVSNINKDHMILLQIVGYESS